MKLIFKKKVIIKLLNGPRYVVTCKKAIDTKKLKVGIRVALDFSTLTIMRILPREIDPAVFSMIAEGNINNLFSFLLFYSLILSHRDSKDLFNS
jgi:ATP-dependent 26S proteasome regulatory subunit